MKQSLPLTLFKQVPLICATLAALTGVSVQAQTIGTDLSVAATLITSNSITQGQPIILKYSVTNITATTRSIGMKEDCSNWLSLNILDAAGQEVVGHPVSNPTKMDISDALGIQDSECRTPGSIQKYTTLPGYVVANLWFPVLLPGNYTLTAHVHLFYRTVSTSTVAEGKIDEQDFQFPLLVTKTDSTRLQTTAQALVKSIVNFNPAVPVMERDMRMQALFSMPSDQAKSSWEALLSDPGSSSWVLIGAADDLSCLRSAAATDVLMEMLVHPIAAQDASVRSAVIAAMGGIYRDATPSLRQHIRSLYADNGRPLADIVGVPSSIGHGS